VCVALVPALWFAVLHWRAVDYPYVWTDITAIGEKSMIRPAGEIVASFGEPLHRIDFRGGGVKQPYYRPLQVVLLSLAAQSGDDSPRAFRELTIGVGALCVAAWGIAVWILTGSVPAATFAALFVAAHPVAIESTTWISGMSGSLCAMFSVLAIALGIRSASASTHPRAAALGFASMLALLAALLSKERAAIEPVLFVACSIAAHQAARVRIDKRIAAAIACAHLAISEVYMTLWRPTIVGTLPPIPPIGGNYATQIATSIANWPAALGWIFFPVHSTTSDVLPIVRSLVDWRFGLGAAVAMGSALAALALLRRRPMSFLGLVWIWVAFAPTSGVIPSLHATGERYLYLSSFGAALLLADAVPGLLSAVPVSLRRPLLVALASLWILGLSQRTWTRLPDWQSTPQLFGPAVARDPDYREGQYLLALDEYDRGQFDAARERLLPLLDGLGGSGSDATGTPGEKTSYLNPLSTFELACASSLALQDYRGVLAIERIAASQHHPTRSVATFRTCVGQARNALGDTDAAQQIYVSVAAELGAATPPRLFVMIARNWIKLGRMHEAREALQTARTAVVGNAQLEAQVRRLTTRLHALETSASADN